MQQYTGRQVWCARRIIGPTFKAQKSLIEDNRVAMFVFLRGARRDWPRQYIEMSGPAPINQI